MHSFPFESAGDALIAESKAMHALAQALLGRVHDAEDATQDAWLSAVRNMPAEVGSRSGWLTRVVRNFALRIARRRRSRDDWEQRASQPEATESTADTVARVEAHRRVVQAVLGLDEPYRTTVLLRFWDALPPREIARRMRVPVATVQTRLRRAVAALRGRLDREFGSRAAWAGLLAPALPLPISTAAFAVAGVLLMFAKTKLALAAAAAAALLWFTWDAATPTTDAGPESVRRPDSTVVRAAAPLETPAAGATRELVPPREPAPVPGQQDASRAVQVLPYVLHVHVVDSAGKAVPEATVEIWDAERAPPERTHPTLPGNSYTRERSGSEPFLRRLTGVDGRCVLELDREFCYLHAAKEGVGESLDWPCSRLRAELKPELIVALKQGVAVDGRVLRSDGTPAAAATVRIADSIASEEIARAPRALVTDHDGRFNCVVRPDRIYEIEARAGGEHVRERLSTIASPAAQSITLQLPGAFAIRGIVLDSAAQPVPGATVKLWTGGAADQIRSVATHARTDEEGSFLFKQSEPGAFQILGSGPGHANTSLTSVEITRERPYADVTLRLRELVELAGYVRRQDGAAIAGALVFLQAEQGADPMRADRVTRHDLYGRIEPVRTDDMGGFRFDDVHPDTTYRLVCRPDRAIASNTFARGGISPGTLGLVVVPSEAELQGTRITGTVHAAATGAMVEVLRVKVHHERPGSEVQTMPIHLSGTIIEMGRFTLPPLSRGERYWLLFEADRLAPKYLGPIETTTETQDLRIELEEFGAAKISVRDANNAPAVDMKVTAWPAERVPGTFRMPVTTDRDGCVTIDRLGPGDYDIRVLRERKTLAEQRITIRPSTTARAELRLPR